MQYFAGFACGVFFMGLFVAMWHARWDTLLDSVRIYLRYREQGSKLLLTPYDLFKITERERDDGFTVLPLREHVELKKK